MASVEHSDGVGMNKIKHMNYSAYIITQKTPEYDILDRAGIDRNNLEVTRWKGDYRRSPMAWKLKGLDNVKKFCLAIKSTLGEKTKLTSQERKAYNKAIKMLNGIEKLLKKEQRLNLIKELQFEYLRILFTKKYQFLTQDQINITLTELLVQKFDSLESLEIRMKALNHNAFKAHEEAKEHFTKIFRI